MDRRRFLKSIGISSSLITSTQITSSRKSESRNQKGGNRGVLRKISQTVPSESATYTEGVIRDDGKYGVVATFNRENGTYLIDLSDPWNPTVTHHLGNQARNMDVKFGGRDGLYYRTKAGGGEDGFEVVDYGYSEGTPENPQVLAQVGDDNYHNLFPHPEEEVVYNTSFGGKSGMMVWDVSDPANPKPGGDDGFGPRVVETETNMLHDIVVDPERELLHAAYIGKSYYAIFDVSDPLSPERLGVFDYSKHPDYREIGKPGFEACHYADYDPERGLAVVGDEKSGGVPGGKHVFDIGWKNGSPSDPKPVGFTHSPNAKRSENAIRWTTHNHDVVTKKDSTFLVSGDYAEGIVVYDITDPTNPTPSMRYKTDDRLSEVDIEANRPDGAFGQIFRSTPSSWGADYAEERELGIATDFYTGVYVFKVREKSLREILTEEIPVPDLGL